MLFRPKTLKEALGYDCHSLGDRVLEPEEVTSILSVCDALWIHSGEPKDPHAVTTLGKCTNGFIDTLRALRHTNLCHLLALSMANQLVEHFPGYHRLKYPPSWVIGSDHAGATVSHSMAYWLGAMHDFTEKGPVVDKKKTQRWSRFEILPGEWVLQAEELITTTATLGAVRQAIRVGNQQLGIVSPVQFVPVVSALVHRSDQYEFEGGPILSQAHYDIKTWEKEECPLCAQGSERIEEPKKHWARLTGKQ